MRRNTLLETITALTFLVFVGVVLYYSFYPFKVTTLENVIIDKAEYCRGEWVQIDLRFVKHMDVQATVKWYIVDGIIYELDSPGLNRPAGENNFVVSKQVPHSILPGEYHMRVEMRYEVHPLHKPIINTWNTATFTVLDADECPSNPEENLSFPDPQNKPVLIIPVPTPLPPKVESSSAQPPPSQFQEGSQNSPNSQASATIHEPQSNPPDKEPTPVKDLLDTVLAPVQGLFKP